MKSSASRRKSREAALRALYEIEISRKTATSVLESTLEYAQLPEPLSRYTEEVVRGICARMDVIDKRLSGLIPDYDFSRLAAVDRNLLRLAAYELIYMPEMPPAVTLNEAIEIAKKYSTAESGRFVNGVLATLLSKTEKADWKSQGDELEAGPIEVAEDSLDALVEPIEQVDVNEDEAKKLAKIGGWTLRSEPKA